MNRTLTAGGTIRVFLFADTPYLHLPGAGDVMMFPTGRDTFTIRAAPGLRMTFERAANQSVTGVTLILNGATVKAVRSRPP